MNKTEMEIHEMEVIAERVLSKSTNFGNRKVGKYLGEKVPERFEHLKYFYDTQKILGALYIAEGDQILQVVDVGVFQIIVTET
jgi:hypothetical protein